MSNNISQCQDLATKAELQQLRDEINALLGKPNNGSNTIDVLAQGTLANTEINARLVDDFEISINPQSGDIQTIFFVGAPGSGITQTIKSNATQAGKLLYDIGKAAIKTGQLGWKLSRSSEARAKLNEQIWKEVANYIDSNDSLRKTEIDLRNHINRTDNFWKAIDKAGGDFANAVSNVRNYKQIITDKEQDLNSIRTQVQNNSTSIRELQNDDFLQKILLGDLNQSVADLENFLTTNTQLDTQFRYEIETEITLTRYQLSRQSDEIDDLIDATSELNTRVSDIETIITTIELDFNDIRLEQDDLEQRIINIEGYILNPNNANIPSIRPATTEDTVVQIRRGGGGMPVGVQQSIINQQTSLIDLLDNLTGNDSNFSTTYFDIVNNQSNFQTIADNLITQVPDITTSSNTGTSTGTGTGTSTGTNQVNQQELDDSLQNFRTDVNSDMQTIIAAVIANTVTPPLNNIQSNTTPSAISNAVDDTLCQQANDPNSCMNTQIRDPIQNNIGNVDNAVTAGFGTLNAILNNQILARVNGIQNFLNTAWNSTIVDKTLNAMNTALALHNALMLSRNLGQSVAEVTNSFLNAIGVKDGEGNDIEVDTIVSTQMTRFINATIGAQNAQAITNTLTSANRIITAAQGVVGSVRGIKDALQNGQEIIANRVGSLGNSFMSQGILEENSFRWMETNNNFRNPFAKFTQSVSNLQEVIDETNELVQTGIEVQENVQQIFQNTQNAQTAREELEESFNQFNLNKEADEAITQTDSSSPDIDDLDLVRDEN